jgi:hypothetical protein
MHPLNPQVALHPDAPYFSVLLCLTPDDFTRQVESAATQWVNYHILYLFRWTRRNSKENLYEMGQRTV